MKSKSLRDILSGRIHEAEIFEICIMAQGHEGDDKKSELFSLLFDADKRVSDNAAWVFTNFSFFDNEWLYDKHDALIDEAMNTTSDTKRRLILNMLLRQPFPSDDIRTDFLDFCLNAIVAADQPCGIRANCMKLAYEQCQYFPELLSELQMTLESLEDGYLSAGLKSAKKNILKKLKIGKKKV